MTKTFSAQVDAHVLKYKKRVRATVQASIADVIKGANTPTGKGGRMRVDTGFLRASGRLSYSGLPSGPNRAPGGAEPNSYDWNASSVIAQLKGLKIGDTVFFGWTADYASLRETYDGFLEAELQNWQQIVNKNAAIAVARIR